MSSLLDRINKNMSQRPSRTPQIGQEQVQSVLQAKGGKATTGAGVPAASSILQDTARQQADQQMRQQTMAGDLAKTQLQTQFQTQAQQTELAEDQLAAQKEMERASMQASELQAARIRDAQEEQARMRRSADENMKLDALQSLATRNLRSLATERDVQLDNMFAEFEQSNKELADRKDAARLEQIAFDMALSDRAYIDTIESIGRQRRLDSDLNFRDETARITLGEELDLLRDEMEWGRAFNADRRLWEQEVAKIDLNSALAIARAEIKANNSRMMWEGIGNTVSTGIDQYSKQNRSNNSGTGGQTGSDSMNTMPGTLA